MKTKLHSSFGVCHSTLSLLTAITLLATAALVPAQTNWGNALSFDGTNDYLLVTNFGAAMPTHEVTVEFRARLKTKMPSPAVFVLAPDDLNNRFLVHLGRTDNRIYWDFGDAAATGTNAGRLWYDLTNDIVGVWQHFAFVASQGATNMTIYQNGVVLKTATQFNDFARGSYDLVIGQQFCGVLDELRIWNVARTQTEIQSTMNAPLTGVESNLVAYYRFDEAAGTNAVDATTNHLDGMLVNGPAWVLAVLAAPTTMSLPASGVTMTSAMLNGSVNPNGTNTTAWFQWGATTSYGGSTVMANIGSGTNAVAMSEQISGLSLGTTYHYRVVGSNTLGVAPGLDMAFTILLATNLADSGEGSLRQTIADAASGDIIALTNTGTIILTTGELAITNDVSIVGPGATHLAISGNNSNRVFNVSDGVRVSVTGLTLRDGRSANGANGASAGAPGQPGSNGGGIYNAGWLQVTDCIITNNRAGNGGYGIAGAQGGAGGFGAPGGYGGAGGSGGGIYNSGTGELYLDGCSICGNFGGTGGLGGAGGRGNDSTSTGYHGGAGGSGGTGGMGAGVQNIGHLTMTRCTVNANTDGAGGAGGMGGNGGDCTTWPIPLHWGGDGWTGGTGGVGGCGGGVYGNEYTALINCTISGNANGNGGNGGRGGNGGDGSTTGHQGGGGNGGNGGSGGGIYNSDQLSLACCTIPLGSTGTGGTGGALGIGTAGSATAGASGGVGRGGGLYSSGAPPSVINTIVALNTRPASVPDDAFGTFASAGHNLIGDTNGSAGFGASGDLLNTNPLLGPLADNGGLTLTHAPLTGSPIVNAGDNTGAPATDQRGLPRIMGGAIDMGSLELEYLPEVATLPATDISAVEMITRATLNGTINPNGVDTATWFEWGTSLDYDHVTSAIDIGGSVALPFSRTLSNLTAGVVYHYRVVASNVVGVVHGEGQPFWAPAVVLNGPERQTNECHLFVFEDPGATIVSACSPGIAGGDFHSIALNVDGAVIGWGTNNYGQADGALAGNNVVRIAACGDYDLGLKSDGTVIGWGDNSYGQTNPPAGATNVVAIAAGHYHGLALRDDGTVVGWGDNSYGQTNIPESATNVIAVTAGEYSSLALRADGTVVGWGANDFGELTIPESATNVTAIVAGFNHVLALRSDSSVVGWGRNYEGQVTIPDAATNVVAIAAGAHHSIALRADHTVVAWGNNNYGQANGASAGSNVVAIAGGRWHSLAIRADGTTVAWGRNDAGQTTIPDSATNLNLVVSVTGAVDPDTPGTNVLTYTTTNALGATATAIRTIVVKDTLPPVLTLLGTNSLVLEVGTLYADAGATASDVCGGDLTASIVSNLTVNTAVPGNYINTFTVTDASGNVAGTNRVVRVVDGPVVATLSATDIGAESVTLRGQVNPNGLETVAWFEWGATTNYGSTTTTSAVGDGFAGVVPTTAVGGLTLGTVYHYRAWASNSLGVVPGSDQSFTAGYQTVTTLADSGAGSLRQALADAGSGGTIYFAVTGTISLTSAQLTIADNVNLVGSAFTNLHVSGNDARRVFYVNAGVTSVISGLTIRNGHSSNGGTGTAGSPGGGIYNAGNLTLNDCYLANNRAGNGGGGSTGSTGCSGGSGGAGGAGGNGGAIYNHTSAILTLNRCTISANYSGNGGVGGYGGQGTVIPIIGVGCDGGSGGAGGTGGHGAGVYNAGSVAASLCTISGNQNGTAGVGGHGGAAGEGWADDGTGGRGGNGGTGGSGSGIYSSGSFATICCTIANNSVSSGAAGGLPGWGEGNYGSGSPGPGGQGGGIRTTAGSAQCINSIVAGNSATNVFGRDVAGVFVSLGHNLIGQRDGSTGFTNGIQGDLVGTYASPLNSLLGPLAYNGGTPTRALLAGSPALNAGDNSAGCPTDQRGVTRCGTFDIGAYEMEFGEPPTLVLLGDNPLTHLAGTAFVDPGAIAMDVCGADLTGVIVSNITVNIDVPGIYTNTFSVTDAGTNSTVAGRTVFVVDVPWVSGLAVYLTPTNLPGGSRSATLQATVSANGCDTLALIQYGLTTAYSGSSPTAWFNGYASSNLTASFEGLIPGVTYHWHVYASNTLGVAYVPDQTFSVPAIFTPGDVNGDGIVDEDEFAGVLAGLNGNGIMNEAQLNLVLSNYYASSPWLYITNTAGLGGTNVTFSLSNSLEVAYSVLMSTNLVDWEYLGPATPRYLFTDTNAPALPQRFYRLRWP